MSKAITYRPQPRWQIWLALGGSILIHVGAIAASHTRPALPLTATGEDVVNITFEQPDTAPEEPPPIDTPEEPLQPPAVSSDFREEVTPVPVYRFDRAKPRPLKPRSIVPSGPARMSAMKIGAVNAPRPDYPYEARRQHMTGSGVAMLHVDPTSGYVTSVEMRESTGSKLLDNATIAAFRRWRFRPGTATMVQTPITFTLLGVQY